MAIINSTLSIMTSGLKDVVNNLRLPFYSGGIATLILTLLFVFHNSENLFVLEFWIAMPFFILLYFLLFVIGKKELILATQSWIGRNRINVLVFPSFLFLLYLNYLFINHQPLFRGNPWIFLYILFFPSLVFGWMKDPSRKIGWIDFSVFVLLFLPTAFFEIKQNSNLPVSGNGFDSVSHIMTMLSGVYAFAIVRGIREVGFTPDIKWKSFRIAFLVWLSFYSFVFIVGRSVSFIEVIGYKDPISTLLKSIFFTFVVTFLHTALFEELFFRGILQNMLARRIGQGQNWFVFWIFGFIVLFAGALVVGYTLKGKMQWFPALITVALFISAYLIEKSGKHDLGVYTALAITGVTFGLVHYHAKSIIYIGFACLAGWAYGYTYLKTKSVFYSALVHTLVNCGILIFGLKMLK